MTKKYIIGGIIVFVVTALIAFFVFSKTVAKPAIQSQIPTPQKLANGTVQFDPNLPKTEPCPINGTLYSTQQRDWWQKHRPLGVMIENSSDARPQSGISYADIVYEAVAEGGITRTLDIFYCQDAPLVGTSTFCPNLLC